MILLPKPRKPPGQPSSHRPSYQVHAMGKLLAAMILNRLKPVIESKNGLSDDQFDFRFRKGRSTSDTINEVIEYTDRLDGYSECHACHMSPWLHAQDL